MNNILIRYNIKSIIFRNIYQKIDRKNVFRILNEEEQEKAEYKYIDIIVPKIELIDYISIENILNIYEINSGLGEEIFEIIKDYDKQFNKSYSMNDKIMKLFEKKIIIPIIDDFVRYHKDNEKYDRYIKYDKIKDSKKRKYKN